MSEPDDFHSKLAERKPESFLSIIMTVTAIALVGTLLGAMMWHSWRQIQDGDGRIGRNYMNFPVEPISTLGICILLIVIIFAAGIRKLIEDRIASKARKQRDSS